MVNHTQLAGEKGLGWLFVFIVLVFLFGSYFFITEQDVTEHQVIEDLDSMVFALSSLQTGDVDGFVEGLVGSIPVLGVFLLVFGIVYFLSSTILGRLFKRKNVVIVFSVVVTVYTFMNQTVYNYIITLHAFTIALLVFFLLLIMLWGFGKDAKKKHDDVLALLRDSSMSERESRDLLQAAKKKSKKELEEFLQALKEQQ